MKNFYKISISLGLFLGLTFSAFAAEIPYLDVFQAVMAPITEESIAKMDRKVLVRVMQLRDFNALTPELQQKLAVKIFKEFGPRAKTKVSFEYPDVEKAIIVKTLQSEEVSISEKNIDVLIRIRLKQVIDVYQTRTVLSGSPVVQGSADEALYWINLYSRFLTALDVKPPPAEKSIEKLKSQFKQVIDSYNKDQQTRAYIFTGLLIKTIAVRKFGDIMEQRPLQKLMNGEKIKF